MSKFFVGIDLGGTNVAVGVVNEQYEIVGRYKTPTLAGRPFAEIVADMARAAQAAVADAGLTLADITHVGIGVPSTIAPGTRRVVFANNLGWVDRDILGEFGKHLALPAFAANDADCAAYGEVLAGAARNWRNVLMITLGTGVGGGIILDKKIFLGGSGHGCEPGHTTIAMDGEPCTCGRRGCLEAYASVTALIRDTRRAMAAHPESLLGELCGGDPEKIDGRTAFDAARRGDAAAAQVVANYIHYLAVGLSSFVTLLRPEAILIGGGVSNEGENLLAPLRREVRETAYAGELMPETPILRATLGNDAGIIGAAFLGCQYE